MALEQENWESRDMRYIWHPAAQMKDYEALPPMVIARGKGVWLYDVHGKKYLDIISSWWCNLFGHCNPIINQAVKEQIDNLEHVIFANFSNEAAIRLAEALAKIVPKGLAKFHFNDNGSAAVEAALKMCFQYHLQTGHPERQKFMCLSEGYHGETIGALSVGSLDLYAQMYKPMMMENVHVEAPDCYRCPYGKDRDHCQCECFEHAEKAFEAHGKETAAIIVEPLLQGSAGMRVYPPLYLKKLRKLCDEAGVLLIADEIATGFGRTGRMFACDHAGIAPDIMTISKGLTGGYLPMSVTVRLRRSTMLFTPTTARARPSSTATPTPGILWPARRRWQCSTFSAPSPSLRTPPSTRNGSQSAWRLKFCPIPTWARCAI